MSLRSIAALGALTLALTAGSGHARTSDFVFTKQKQPAGVVVTDSSGNWAATFTKGSRTVTLAGPARTFTEAAAPDVTTGVWVRLLPSPFKGKVDTAWLSAALADTSPDVLAVGMQYLAGAPAAYDASGAQIAGDADYGPLQPDGTRQEGSDFNDYLGVPWTYKRTVDTAEPAQLRSLDCSGFVRMVFGYRGGVPLGLEPGSKALPRRSFQLLDSAPGTVVAASASSPPVLAPLAPGDLVFFDADEGDGDRIDHAGIYLGVDANGDHRFLSSRKSINGPTFGDVAGKSLLNGSGLYARSFRAARRL